MSEIPKNKFSARLVNPADLALPHEYDMTPGKGSAEKVEQMRGDFEAGGYDMDQPPLVGYEVTPGDIQLLDGGHRAQAAQQAGIDVPVLIKSREDMKNAQGTPQWEKFTHTDVPAKDFIMLGLGDLLLSGEEEKD
jgi:hypothetical protein